MRTTLRISLWDELGINHDPPKQRADTLLDIIGFLIDIVALTATLPAESKSCLLDSVHRFIDPVPSRRRTLS